MTVRELILKLKKVPQNLDVGLVPFDMPSWLAGDWACSVHHIVKNECTGILDTEEIIFEDMPEEYIVIHG